MRRIVLKHARGHRTDKRGGRAVRVPLDEAELAIDKSAADLIALDEALDRLATFDDRQSRIVEMRYFGGLTIDEVATCLDLSTATVKREARIARAWLQREMSQAEAVPS